ncbi:MAG: diguanylate cyclase [Selenomonadaceae bacterium]|nr:diguanylate cyclase [Selenomonadaceae bacterium]
MKRDVYRFCLAACWYWLVETFAGQVLNVPEQIVNIAVFIPPVFGLMWGRPAAIGAYVGGLFVLPDLQNLFFQADGLSGRFLYVVRGLWVFIAAYLPYFLWRNWLVSSNGNQFSLGVHTLQKFIAVMLVTFFATSAFRSLTATPAELEATALALGVGKSATFFEYMLVCFANDFCVAMFLDLAWFFLLVSRGYAFKGAADDAKEFSVDENSEETNKSWLIALCFYILFPVGVVCLDKFQIYGMDRIETWMTFIVECLLIIDVYLLLMLYLLLRYRRSIMMEVVFLVAQTVFFSATVLGWGSSLAMNNFVNAHANDSLHAMSVICRERLYRTFFCVRQAVNGMELQALGLLESYDRLVTDANYRTQYLNEMKRNFNAIAVKTDGAIAYYLRLSPEIAGTKGGFSMGREDVRWEGALPPFVQRNPIDLAPYSSVDWKNVGWFYIPLKSKCATWIEPYVDPVTKNYVISYVAPLFVDGKFIGVIGMDIDFNFIIQELRRMSIYDYGYVYLLNRNNQVLYHRKLPQGVQFQPNPDFQEIELYLSNGMWLGIATPLSRVYDERNRILMHLVAAIVVVAMLISFVSIVLASKAIRPLAGMTEAARRIASGDLNVEISYESGNELGILVQSIREMAAKLEEYVYRDKLTGLRNAAAYISKSKDLDAQKDVSSDLNYGVVLFDANFLKKVNDNYGHEAGNELLRHASKVICKVFAHSPVYRIGGDEFTAILEGEDYENREALLKLFDEKVAEETFEVAGNTLFVSVARGLGVYEPGMNFEEVSKKADAAMYNHKAAIKAKYGEEVR